MPDSSLFRKVPVKVVNRSGFDKSFRNLLTTKCGTLTPLMCDEVIPNTDGRIRVAISAQLPPLASETFMNVNLKMEAFFCPTRLLMAGYEDFLRGKTDLQISENGYYPGTPAKLRAPVVEVGDDALIASLTGPGSLTDYLGLKTEALPALGVNKFYLTAFPYLAYHLVWDTWYRNALIQNSCFDEDIVDKSNFYQASAMRYKKPNTVEGYTTFLYQQLRDGVRLGELRQRNFGYDYFTTATPSPQSDSPMGIHFDDPENPVFRVGDFDEGSFDNPATPFSSVPNSALGGLKNISSDSGFTIAALRAANSLQQFKERQQLAPRLVDYVKVNYNANLKDSIAQRPVYLGSASYPVYSKGVYSNQNESESSNNNPFTSVGSRYGHAFAEGSDFVCDFHVDEPGYILVLVSLVPEVTYSSGVNRMLTRYVEEDSYSDLANAMLQNVGPQPIFAYELVSAMLVTPELKKYVFGYTDRYADFMTRQNELHGLLRDGQSLASFALQRNLIGDDLEISSGFLQIPTDFMDQVSAVDADISNYGVWIDSYIDYKVVMPLQRYCIPSLQDPAYEHGDTVMATRGGKRIE